VRLEDRFHVGEHTTLGEPDFAIDADGLLRGTWPDVGTAERWSALHGPAPHP
jgi:hypothetical protein